MEKTALIVDNWNLRRQKGTNRIYLVFWTPRPALTNIPTTMQSKGFGYAKWSGTGGYADLTDFGKTEVQLDVSSVLRPSERIWIVNTVDGKGIYKLLYSRRVQNKKFGVLTDEQIEDFLTAHR